MPVFVARREIQEAEVVVANHALVMAAMESEAVLPEPKNLLLVLDEGHHLPDVARDALEMSAEITAPGFACNSTFSANWWQPALSNFVRKPRRRWRRLSV
jgi:ATP-dependent DNA helicase DinG